MRGIVERVGGGGVDGHSPRLGRGIGRLPGMQLKRLETQRVFLSVTAHDVGSARWMVIDKDRCVIALHGEKIAKIPNKPIQKSQRAAQNPALRRHD